MSHGYRDVLPLFENLGIDPKMPALLQPSERQLGTQTPNVSRTITKTRWLVDASNGHIKTVFKFFKETVFMNNAIKIGDFYVIAGAILNKYREPVVMMEGSAEVDERMLEKYHKRYVIQARVEMDSLHTRNAQWAQLTQIMCPTFQDSILIIRWT